MGHYVQIGVGHDDVMLPNGQSYDAGAVVFLTDEQFAGLSPTAVSGGTVVAVGTDSGVETVLSFPVDLAAIAAAGDVVTNFTPGFAGRIISVAFVVTKPVTTAAKAATLNLEIGSTNLTGGVIALTSANATPLGKVIVGTTITAADGFDADDTISVEAASVTAFVEGEGVLLVTVTS